jgi:hypothetical protein
MMKIWGITQLCNRLYKGLTTHLELTTPDTPDYESASEEEVRELWANNPKKHDEALRGLEASFAYRDRSGSNSLVMKGLIFTGFFALTAMQLTVGLTTTSTPFLVAATLFMVTALYTLAGARCIGEAFRPTPGQLNPTYLKDERVIKLVDGMLAQYLEVGGREWAQRLCFIARGSGWSVRSSTSSTA